MQDNLADPPRRIIKLNQNENPFGTSPKALKAIEETCRASFRYPDVFHTELKQKLSTLHQVAPENIIIAAGSIDLMDICVKAFSEPGDNIITAAVTFEGYKYIAGANRRECRLAPLTDYRIDLGEMLKLCDSRTRLIFIANPNNPTGTIVRHAELVSFLAALPTTAMVVSDEAYSEYITDAEFPKTLAILRESCPNLIIFHTFSKVYGLAGLRIGYAISRPQYIELMTKVRTPFAVSRLALAAAAAALGDREFLTRSALINESEREKLYDALKRLRFNVVESQGNFLFVNFADASGMNRMFDCLAMEGILIRKLQSFGVENGLRITIGRPEENSAIIETLETEYGR